MPAFLTNEMSAYKSGCGNMFFVTREVGYANILPKARTGAGNEGARGNLKGSKWADSLVPGSRNIGYIL